MPSVCASICPHVRWALGRRTDFSWLGGWDLWLPGQLEMVPGARAATLQPGLGALGAGGGGMAPDQPLLPLWLLLLEGRLGARPPSGTPPQPLQRPLPGWLQHPPPPPEAFTVGTQPFWKVAKRPVAQLCRRAPEASSWVAESPLPAPLGPPLPSPLPCTPPSLPCWARSPSNLLSVSWRTARSLWPTDRGGFVSRTGGRGAGKAVGWSEGGPRPSLGSKGLPSLCRRGPWAG